MDITWRQLKEKSRTYHTQVGKTWIMCYGVDFTKHHKIVKNYDITATNVKYSDMLTAIKSLSKAIDIIYK